MATPHPIARIGDRQTRGLNGKIATMRRTRVFSLPTTGILILGCAGNPTKPHRRECGRKFERAWKELDLASAEGFAGSVSYSKALSLITPARADQAVENFDNCYEHAKDARYYISESRQGR
jgi:hypothetical protein